MEVKGELLSNWTFFKDQWENYKVATRLREKSKGIDIILVLSVNPSILHISAKFCVEV